MSEALTPTEVAKARSWLAYGLHVEQLSGNVAKLIMELLDSQSVVEDDIDDEIPAWVYHGNFTPTNDE